MKRTAIFCISLVLLTILSACSVPTAQPAAGTPTDIQIATPLPTVPPATDTPAAVGINLDLLKNFTYVIEDLNTKVTLKDGVFEGDHIHSQLVRPIAVGDVNGDGLQDAVVVLATNLGGSGTFYDLVVVLNQNGTPVEGGYSPFGDRQGVKNLQIANGRVVLDYLTQGLNDPLCCPSEHRLRVYVLENGSLRLASEQVLDSPTAQATPLPVEIQIDQP